MRVLRNTSGTETVTLEEEYTAFANIVERTGTTRLVKVASDVSVRKLSLE
jgi:hypothetical protein